MEIEWRAKKRNNDKRVSAYSNPCVHEVIYSGEWKNKMSKGLLGKLKDFFEIIFL